MLGKRPKFLFISHDASLSGAPILLLNLSKLLVNNQKAVIHFIINRDGVLANEFRKIAPTTILKSIDYGKEKSYFKKITNFTIHKLKLIGLIIKVHSYNLIFSNTIVNGKLLKQLLVGSMPVITYVHELEEVIELYVKQKDAVFSLKRSDMFAYPSLQVRNLLIDKYKIQSDKLKRLSYYFPFQQRDIITDVLIEKKTNFRRKYGFAENDFLIGNMGTISERKGTDIFIDVCEKVVFSNPGIKFCWIGSFQNKEHEHKIKQSIEDRNLSKNIVFTGPLPNDLYNTASFDVLFLSSREDPYPLVVLEAALMHVPTICFSKSGGIVEFIGIDSGWKINNFSIDDAAIKIIELESARNEVISKSENAFKKIIELHCNSEVILSQFTELISKIENMNS